MSVIKFRHFNTLSMIVAGALITIAFHGAAAQTPPPNQATPPPPAPAQLGPAASPANPPPPPSQAAPPPPPGAATPPPPGPPPHSGPEASAVAHAVTHTNVNLRNGPGTTYTVVTLIHAGSSVEVSGCKNGWCQVVFEGQNGYIIESSIAPGAPGPARRPGPPPGYAGPPGPPPPGYVAPPPGYYPPPPGYYPPPYYYGGYYGGPYWGWRRGYWRRW